MGTILKLVNESIEIEWYRKDYPFSLWLKDSINSFKYWTLKRWFRDRIFRYEERIPKYGNVKYFYIFGIGIYIK